MKLERGGLLVLRLEQKFVVQAALPQDTAVVVGGGLVAGYFVTADAVGCMEGEFYLRLKQDADVYLRFVHGV